MKATGDVLLRSELSFGRCLIVEIPNSFSPDFTYDVGFPSLIDFKIDSIASPKYIDTIAGGASLAPSLKSFPLSLENNLIKGAYLSTASIKAETNNRNLTF